MCQHGYRGDGAFGEYMVVLPEQDTVVTFFSNTEPMQPFLDLLVGRPGPAIDRGGDPDPEGDRAVAERTAGLRLPTAAERTGVPGTGAAPAAGRFTRHEHGHHHHTITAVEVGHGHLTIHEGDDALRVPLGDCSAWAWTRCWPACTHPRTEEPRPPSVSRPISRHRCVWSPQICGHR